MNIFGLQFFWLVEKKLIIALVRKESLMGIGGMTYYDQKVQNLTMV
jgi:hypothetical protein